MTPAQIRTEVDRFITTLFEEGLALDGNRVLLLESPGETIVTWSNEATLSELFELSTWDEYIATIQRRWFSVVLWDGAYLQFSYTFSGTRLIKHRLCYFPCPISFMESEAANLSIEDMMTMRDDGELRKRVKLEGPLRFDFDESAATANHPAVHMTLLRSSCRIPVAYPLSLGHFVRFVFSNFYPDQFGASVRLREVRCETGRQCLSAIADDTLYYDWKQGL